MKLSKIELSGFKSFRAKTGIEVGDGITAVVGPNGCGKSNIVDAIRWAMGTQSARSLRGSEMADVIFAGSRSQKPAGLAEVSLHFENNGSGVVAQGDLARSPLAALADGAGELTVTRRLFRSGESVYLINGVTVRLKDIHELFLGTGASVRGYSIIEQGQIEFLVNARPTERRAFVEELAGVTRYRYHRQETERKLAGTEQNLERLEDLLDEVRRRVAQLKRQARVAQRHAELSRRRRLLEMAILLGERRAEQQTLAAAQAAHASARADYRAASERLDDDEAALEQMSEALAACEAGHAELTEEVYRQRAKRDLLKQSIEHTRGECGRIEQEQDRIADDEAELSAELASFEARSAALEAAERASSNETSGDAVEGEAAQLQAAVDEATREVEALESELDRVAERLAGVTAQLAQHQAIHASRQSERERLAEQATRGADRAEALSARVTNAMDQVAEAERGLAELATQQGDLEAAGDDRRQALVRERERRAELRRQIEQLDQKRAARQARLEALAETAAGEVSEGAGRVLEAVEMGRLSGVVGIVGDGVIVPQDSERAVHGVLRELLEYVVVVDTDAAHALIRFAETEGLVVGCIEADVDAASPSIPERGLLARVEVAPWVPSAVRRVLGGAEQVSRLLRPTGDGSAVHVDAKGNCASAHGFWRSSDPEGSALARRARHLAALRALEETLTGLHGARERLSEELAEVEGQADQLEASQRADRQAIDGIRARRAELEAVRARAQAEAQAARRQVAEHEESRRLEAVRAQALAADAEQAQTAVNDLAGERVALEAARDAMRQDRHDLRARLEAHVQALTEFQTVRREQLAAIDRLRQERRRLETDTQRARDRLERLDARRAELAERLEWAKLEIETNEKTAELAQGGVEAAERDLEAAARRLEQLRQTHKQRGAALKELRQRCGHLRAETDRQQIRCEQAEREIERAEKTLDQHFGLAVAAAAVETQGVELPAEPRAELAELARQLEGLGPINHAALEELEQAQERHDFLCEQQADLLAAIDDMRLTIQELDCVSRAEFRATFVALRAQFERLFTRLFRGGEATIDLTDEGDPLTAGVEVSVRPPGKKVASMSLLSGGEKALTAVALVFAAFRLKPSPFCVLDEVDAPLDDQNVERFVELIDELSDETQFLVVTHNRRTMEGAHRLVGVTMEEPGCTKLVSVGVPTRRRPALPDDARERAAG